ncbi:uncharacterized protein LOC115236390 [Formica exsecta]|uniref:uncharacterized protein LOC115236390 n=1 Tax=Formica exsecta TaxID=72781 RepID=UPI001143FC6B|nr:uncharacterized protein LOC115236390 [Formica exsecta]
MAEDFRQLYEWIDTRFTNIERTIQNSLNSKNKKKCWIKSSFLPFTSKEEVLKFDNAEEKTYDEVICYLQYVGGFSLKEALNLKKQLKTKLCLFLLFMAIKKKKLTHFSKQNFVLLFKKQYRKTNTFIHQVVRSFVKI